MTVPAWWRAVEGLGPSSSSECRVPGAGGTHFQSLLSLRPPTLHQWSSASVAQPLPH